jgi:membrane protease YdiL (CAAX protease family)
MPTLLDFAFLFTLIVLTSIFEYYVFWPRFKAETTAGRPGARVRGYRRTILGQAGFAAAALAIWWHYRRPAAALRLTIPTGWQLWLGIALVLLMIAFVAFQLSSVARLPYERRVAARPKLGNVTFILPHTRAEHRWFLALSLTAGVCEELLYRGYVVWALTPWLGVLGAFVAATVAFAIGHGYQGWKGVVRVMLVGAVMAAMVLATDWLLPAMIVHALVDIGSGTLGYWLLREPESANEGAPPFSSAAVAALTAR